MLEFVVDVTCENTTMTVGYYDWIEALTFLENEGSMCSSIRTFNVIDGNLCENVDLNLDVTDIWDLTESMKMKKDFVLFDCPGLVDLFLITY